jgi:hypothetical protein
LEPIGAKGCSAIDAYGIGWSYSANAGLGAGSACGAATKPTSLDHVFHFLKVSISGTTVTVAPTDEMGRTFDVQTYSFGTSHASAPTSPSQVVGTPTGQSSIALSWIASTDDVGVVGYRVFRDRAQAALVAGSAASLYRRRPPGG